MTGYAIAAAVAVAVVVLLVVATLLALIYVLWRTDAAARRLAQDAATLHRNAGSAAGGPLESEPLGAHEYAGGKR